MLQVQRSPLLPPPLQLISSYPHHVADHCPSCPPSWAVEPWSALPCPAAESSAADFARSSRAGTPPTAAGSIATGRQPFASIGNLQQQQRRLRGGGPASDNSSLAPERTNGVECVSNNNGRHRRPADVTSGDCIKTAPAQVCSHVTDEARFEIFV